MADFGGGGVPLTEVERNKRRANAMKNGGTADWADLSYKLRTGKIDNEGRIIRNGAVVGRGASGRFERQAAKSQQNSTRGTQGSVTRALRAAGVANPQYSSEVSVNSTGSAMKAAGFGKKQKQNLSRRTKRRNSIRK